MPPFLIAYDVEFCVGFSPKGVQAAGQPKTSVVYPDVYSYVNSPMQLRRVFLMACGISLKIPFGQ